MTDDVSFKNLYMTYSQSKSHVHAHHPLMSRYHGNKVLKDDGTRRSYMCRTCIDHDEWSQPKQRSRIQKFKYRTGWDEIQSQQHVWAHLGLCYRFLFWSASILGSKESKLSCGFCKKNSFPHKSWNDFFLWFS